MRRRAFFRFLAIGTVAVLAAGRAWAGAQRLGLRYLRPPGALPESEFLSRCINCG